MTGHREETIPIDTIVVPAKDLMRKKGDMIRTKHHAQKCLPSSRRPSFIGHGTLPGIRLGFNHCRTPREKNQRPARRPITISVSVVPCSGNSRGACPTVRSSQDARGQRKATHLFAAGEPSIPDGLLKAIRRQGRKPVKSYRRITAGVGTRA